MPPDRKAKSRLVALRLLADDLAGRLPALMISADRIANIVSHGEHGRRRAGVGESFWQHRQHVQGDPASKIDWRQSSKSQNLYVRENEWEAAQSTWLWCDRSLSMDYCSPFAQQSKLERALIITLALAGLLMRGGERAGLLGASTPPRSGSAALNRLASSLILLSGQELQAENLPPVQSLPRFATLVLVGDFLSPIAEISHVIGQYMSQGVTGHILQVLDPAEEDLPFEGRVRFQGLEGEAPFTTGRAQSLRVAYQQRLSQHRGALEALCRNSGWSFAAHSTAHSPQMALLGLRQVLCTDAGAGRRRC